jgi:hypothetical protein
VDEIFLLVMVGLMLFGAVAGDWIKKEINFSLCRVGFGGDAMRFVLLKVWSLMRWERMEKEKVDQRDEVQSKNWRVEDQPSCILKVQS